MFEKNYYPIILIRGFAMRDSDIERASNQAFLGFEEGSTKIRQDAIGEIRRFYFESVVMRLVQDHGYVDCYRDNQVARQADGLMPARSIWTCRYYDLATKSLDGERLPIEDYAKELRRTILQARDAVCGDDVEARQNFKAHLVAHSQGGLVARCYLQNICGDAPNVDVDERAALELDPPNTKSMVANFFSYGVPHNGIELGGVNVPDLGAFSFTQARNFNRKVMRKFLDLPEAGDKEPVNDLNGSIAADRVFCLIGTNWKDYDLVSKELTRETSDGLVMCANAYTVDRSGAEPQHSPRAYISRAHGGPFGMMNSEEGYQNLHRFLFGNWRVDVDVALDAIRLPQNLLKKLKAGQVVRANYCLDVVASVRGQQVVLHERRASTSSAIRFPVEYVKQPGPAADQVFTFKALEEYDPQKAAVSLFLNSALSAETRAGREGPMEFAIKIGIDVPAFEIDNKFWFDQHVEGLSVLREVLRVRIEPETGEIKYALTKDGDVRPKTSIPLTLDTSRRIVGEAPFGPADLKPGGAKGRFLLRAWRRSYLSERGLLAAGGNFTL